MLHQTLILKHFQKRKVVFQKNLKEEIAVEEFSLIDDPHIPEGIGTKGFDDEGIQTQKKNLIENGVFKNTFSNLFDSYKEETTVFR